MLLDLHITSVINNTLESLFFRSHCNFLGSLLLIINKSVLTNAMFKIVLLFSYAWKSWNATRYFLLRGQHWSKDFLLFRRDSHWLQDLNIVRTWTRRTDWIKNLDCGGLSYVVSRSSTLSEKSYILAHCFCIFPKVETTLCSHFVCMSKGTD